MHFFRVLNKFLFFTYGTKDVFERACKGLNRNIELFLDDNQVPMVLPDIEGLVFLNIGCWGAGVRVRCSKKILATDFSHGILLQRI